MTDSDDRLRRALQTWADDRQPSAGLTDRVLGQVRRRIRRRRATFVAAALVVVGTAVGVPLTISARHSHPIRLATAPITTLGQPASACSNSTSGFELSLVSSTGGQPTPQAAAKFFALQGAAPFPVPPNGWIVVAHDTQAATVQSGLVALHVIEGPDHTWQVDSGNRCS